MAGKRGNGEGTIAKRKNGKWAGAIVVGRNSDGSLNRKWFYGDTRKEVADKMQPVLASIQKGEYIEQSSMLFSDWLDTWLTQYKKLAIKLTTYDSYEINIRYHIKPKMGHIKLKDIRTFDIQKFINDTYDNEASTALLRKLKNIVHGSLKQAVINQLIIRNPCEGIILPKHVQKEVRAFSKEEEKSFLQNLGDDRLATAFKLDMVSGLRVGELLGLSWKNVDLDNGIIKVRQTLIRIKDRSKNAQRSNKYIIDDSTKTAAGRRNVPIPKAAVQMLKEHKEKQEAEKQVAEGLYEDNDLLFCTALGNRYIPRNVGRSFVRLTAKAGITGVNIHSLRHTYATRLFEKGVPAKTVSELLGHTNVSHTLNIYTHVLPDMKSEAVKKLEYILM